MNTFKQYLFFTIFIHLFHSNASQKRPPGMSEQQWKETQSFEIDCTECQSCKQNGYGYDGRLEQQYKPLNAAGQAKPKYYLHIVVGTVPRRSSQMVTNYLTQLLDSVDHQLDLPGVHLTIFNHRPGEHTEFAFLQHKYKDSSAISMVDLKANVCDPPRPEGWGFHGGLSPMLRARQQTRDVVNMLLEARDTGRFVLLVEDDFIFCPNALTLMYHKLFFTQQHIFFSAMRFGVGMSGLLMRSSDIPSFAIYLVETQHNMPIDLLATEWYLAAMPISKYHFNKGRQFIINKETLVSHIGDVTSFEDARGIRKTALCGERVRVKSYFEQKESYQKKCDTYELSPCTKFKQAKMVKIHPRGPMQPDAIPRTAHVIMAPPGENCESGCRSSGKNGFDQCFNTEMPKLNTCGIIKLYLPQCKACIVEENVGAQGIGTEKDGFTCVVSTIQTSTSYRNCRTKPKTNEWRQICLCKNRKAVNEHGRISSQNKNRARL